MEKNLRETIIETADRLFYQHGIHAVGINRLIEESGVSKDSFYRNFRSKESLIEAYVRARHEAAMRNFLKVVARHDTPATKSRPYSAIWRIGYSVMAFAVAPSS